eukprot:GFUD01039544.1.p1 GENE.GFUD01039544.1~~GFUD01039544.1.p1  ORF type:complete len:425 (+),score=152.86 GFUD01039544.1:78-1352(+)
MSSQKSSGNGFFQFCRQKQRDNPSWSALSPPDLVELCSPLWCGLSVEGRSRYGRACREAGGGGVTKGGFDSYGRPLVQLVNRSRQKELELEKMKADIKSRVDRALMNHQLEDETFFLLHTNVFCLTAEGGVVPAELSLARVSLRKGVEEIYQEFIEPGTLPKGYRADCTENSASTHKIPLDLALFNGNYQQIVEEMLEFLLALPDSGELPPLYCLPKYKDQNQQVLAWLLDRVQTDLADEVAFKLYSLPVLLYELAREENRSTDTSLSMSSLSGCDTKVPTISLAEAQLDRDMFIYTPGLSCSWHEEVETSYCTSAKVTGWSYMMFSLCCPLYGLELLPGKHVPAVEEMAKIGPESVTTTMSVCSGETGVSREMGRDVTREERDNPLKAWQKATKKLTTSLDEWERFGYQEQSSTDLSSEKWGH